MVWTDEKIMKLVDRGTGMMECGVCGKQRRANIMPNSGHVAKYSPDSWECPNGCTLADLKKKESLGVEIEKRVKAIARLHSEIAGHPSKSPKKAIRIGQLLTQQKESLKHGEFTHWLKVNMPFTQRVARDYMRLYRGAIGPVQGEGR